MANDKKRNAAGERESDLPKLAAPARRALAGAGYERLEQLAGAAEAEVLALHGMGPNAVKTLKAAMAEKGLAFAGERGGANG